MPRRVDAVDADEDFAGTEPSRFDGIDDLLARGLLGIGRNRILKIEDQAIGWQHLGFFQGPRVRSRHVQDAAPRADRHHGPQLDGA
jgi:hypothetical protein